MLLLLKWPINTEIIIYFYHDHKFMSCTTITLKFKMHWFPNKACCWAEKLLTDIKLAPLLPDDNKNFGSSLILDFRISWRHVQAKNSCPLPLTFNIQRLNWLVQINLFSTKLWKQIAIKKKRKNPCYFSPYYLTIISSTFILRKSLQRFPLFLLTCLHSLVLLWVDCKRSSNLRWGKEEKQL